MKKVSMSTRLGSFIRSHGFIEYSDGHAECRIGIRNRETFYAVISRRHSEELIMADTARRLIERLQASGIAVSFVKGTERPQISFAA